MVVGKEVGTDLQAPGLGDGIWADWQLEFGWVWSWDLGWLGAGIWAI